MAGVMRPTLKRLFAETDPDTDWFAANAPTGQTAGRVTTEPTGTPQALTDTGSNGTPGQTNLSPQQYVEAWRQQHPGIHLKQADPAGWDVLEKDMRAVGFNVNLDSRSDGMHKGIMLDG